MVNCSYSTYFRVRAVIVGTDATVFHFLSHTRRVSHTQEENSWLGIWGWSLILIVPSCLHSSHAHCRSHHLTPSPPTHPHTLSRHMQPPSLVLCPLGTSTPHTLTSSPMATPSHPSLLAPPTLDLISSRRPLPWQPASPRQVPSPRQPVVSPRRP